MRSLPNEKSLYGEERFIAKLGRELTMTRFNINAYRVTQQVSELGWVDFDLIWIFHSSCSTTLPILPNFR